MRWINVGMAGAPKKQCWGRARTDLSLDEKTGESLRINGGKMVPGRKKGGRKSHGVPVVSKGQEKACAAPSAGRKGPAGRQGL